MSGYAGIPLVRKLGIKPGHRVRLIGTPPDPPELGIEGDDGPEPYDVILLFCRDEDAVWSGLRFVYRLADR